MKQLASQSGGNGGDSESQDSESAKELTPHVLKDASYEHEGVDITGQVVPLIVLFTVVEEGHYQPDNGQEFLDSAEAFASWAEEKQLTELASKVKEAWEDFATIFHSPLDIDTFLLSVVWEKLGPVLTSLLAKPIKEEPSSPAGPAVDTSSRNAKQEYHVVLKAPHEHSIVSITDASGKILDLKQGFSDISGYSREELIGQDHRLINSGPHP